MRLAESHHRHLPGTLPDASDQIQAHPFKTTTRLGSPFEGMRRSDLATVCMHRVIHPVALRSQKHVCMLPEHVPFSNDPMCLLIFLCRAARWFLSTRSSCCFVSHQHTVHDARRFLGRCWVGISHCQGSCLLQPARQASMWASSRWSMGRWHHRTCRALAPSLLPVAPSVWLPAVCPTHTASRAPRYGMHPTPPKDSIPAAKTRCTWNPILFQTVQLPSSRHTTLPRS